MQVAYLINQYPGISHTFIRREIKALERAGVAVTRIAVRPSKAGIIAQEDKDEADRTRAIVGTPPKELAKAALSTLAAAPLRSARAFFTSLLLGWKSEAGLFRHLAYFVEALVLARWLRDENLAHVHAHFGTNSATVALLAAKIGGGSFSMTVHGPEEFDKPALIGLARKIEASRFTVAVSHFGASQLRRLVGPPHWKKIRIVRCGVERDFGEASAVPQAPIFVSIGRLSPQKGQATLIEAATLLKAEGRAFSVRIIGDGEMRGALETDVRRLDVADRVAFLGWKTPTEVRTELLGARALALPSYAEGLPVSIMEAFSLHRPVIATYVAGVPELVTPGENGWLAPAGDAAALAEAMRAVIEAPVERLEAMGRAGALRVASMHDIDKIAATLKELFVEAVQQRAP